MSKYRHYTFSKANFAKALCLNNKYTLPSEVLAKNQFNYLFEYLSSSDLDAKTIIVEFDYVSKDYLIDFATYFVTCFDQYSKNCVRLHIFNRSLSPIEFENIIVANTKDQSEFWDTCYLGYVVGKPLPIRIIGKTVLKPYYSKDKDGNFRDYFGVRNYYINVFGNKVKLASLGYMEQDSVVSVCATSAIWMMLQKASMNKYAVSKTPSQITDEADIVGTHGERIFPNKGLSVKQISQSIYKSGLVSEIRTIDKNDELSRSFLKKYVHAYAPIGIPLILVLEVPYMDKGSVKYGHHAVTVVGYKLGNPTLKVANKDSNIRFIAENVTKLFTHDDAWGPYASFDFEKGDNVDYRFVTKWSQAVSPNQPTHLTNIVIPLYHKIRITYEDVEKIVVGVNELINLIYKLELDWDITLHYSEQFKTDCKIYDINLAKNILFTSMPKYIWVTKCIYNNKLLFEIIFDATDVAIGMFGFAIYFHNNSLKKILGDFISKDNEQSSNVFHHACKTQFANFILEEAKKDYYSV
ncbi:MAG: hypothetical protein IPG87_07825 [Saprospiraceae bacterium]|nr:hypothetical protein [Candidatus Vicinibacter affinis]